MTEPLRILVTGARTCTEEQAKKIRSILDELAASFADDEDDGGELTEIIVVHGHCPKGGVDLVAHRWAEERADARPEPHPADWKRHGRAAGPIRNSEMVELGAYVCMAFPGPRSVGSWDCLRKAGAAGIPVYLHRLENL